MRATDKQKDDHSNFRERVALSVISRKPLRAEFRTPSGRNDSIRDYEHCILQAVYDLSEGCSIDIDETGGSVTVCPGTLIGGKLSMDVSSVGEQPVSYYLEFLSLICAFCRSDSRIVLRGANTCASECSVELFKSCFIPMVRKIGVEVSVSVVRQGLIDGVVDLTVRRIDRIAPTQLVGESLVKRVRGVLCSSHVSRSISEDVVSACRSLLNQAVSDVWIDITNVKSRKLTDSSGAEGSSFMGLSLIAECESGQSYGVSGLIADNSSQTMEPSGKGIKLAESLLYQVLDQAFCAPRFLWVAVVLASASSNQAKSEICLGSSIPDSAFAALEACWEFLGVRFAFETRPCKDGQKRVYASCVGRSLESLSRVAKA